MIKKIHLWTLLVAISPVTATANPYKDALVYSTAASAISTATAIGLQQAGYEPQVQSGPFGPVTTIKTNEAGHESSLQQPKQDAFEKQQQIHQQRMDFMNQ